MKDSSTFNFNDTISVLLMGQPGSGKTCVAMGFPDPYFLSTDRKLGNAQQLHKGKPFTYDFIADDKDGKILPPNKRWDRLAELLPGCADPKVKTIVLDNLTDVGDWLSAYIISKPALSPKGRPMVAGESIMEMADWQPFYVLMSNLMTNLKAFGKPVVVCCHASPDKDEVTGTVNYYPLIGGKLRTILPSMFSNYWYCDAVPSLSGVKYIVRTQPTPRMMLINSLGLPSEFNFTWDEVAKRIGGAK